MEILNAEVLKINDKERILKENLIKVCVFKPVMGVKYCKSCGSEVKVINELCGVCKSSDFFIGEIAERIGGYLSLSNNGYLKKYAKLKRNVKANVCKLTNKHVAWSLLCLDGFFKEDDKVNFKIIEKVYWKRF